MGHGMLTPQNISHRQASASTKSSVRPSYDLSQPNDAVALGPVVQTERKETRSGGSPFGIVYILPDRQQIYLHHYPLQYNKNSHIIFEKPKIDKKNLMYYLLIPVEHIPTVKDLQWRTEDYSFVSHRLEVKQMLLRQDAPQSTWYRFGFHQPPLNSINHLRLHCLELPYTPRWKSIKFLSRGSIGFLGAEKLLEK